MDAKRIIGQCIRRLREGRGISQDELAHASGITYQYLSGVENGKENFSIGVLEAIGAALDSNLLNLIVLAFTDEAGAKYPTVSREYFRQNVPLPDPLTLTHIEDALNETQRMIHLMNYFLTSTGARPLYRYVQGNNFSGLVSNLLCDSFSQLTPFKHNSYQAYPDLIAVASTAEQSVGLEVKATIKIGKGGESHNGHSEWHLIACFQIDPSTGNILFVHVMLALLNGHNTNEPDWKYVGSQENILTGSRRTETYITNLCGTTKLRDGSVYLDPNIINHRYWKQLRRGEIPVYSIFYDRPSDPKVRKKRGRKTP